MPFDGTPVVEFPKQLVRCARGADCVDSKSSTATPIWVRHIPPWRMPSQEIAEAAIAVLTRARELIADEQRWCQRASARTWLDIPVPVQSRFARRFCAIGAVQRAARELGLSFGEAGGALEWQTIRPIPDWNDDPCRTHDDVVAAFDAAIVALEIMPA